MKYENAGDFRKALENRLRNLNQKTGMPHARLRKMIAFDRFLARLIRLQPDDWVLKGGFALQLRLGDRARTTKDIDLLATNDIEILPAIQEAGYLELGDWFTFEITQSADPVWGGAKARRYKIVSRLDGRIFENFHLDVGINNPIVGKVELLTTPDLLSFADLKQTRVPCYPVAQQIAEKLHAYTRPHKSGISSRVKDFVDILLLAGLGEIKKSELQLGIQATFNNTGTHRLPANLPPPPKRWTQSYKKMIKTLDLDEISLAEAYIMLQDFLNPVLEGATKEAKWNPSKWQWE
jgi:hypothetical protein